MYAYIYIMLIRKNLSTWYSIETILNPKNLQATKSLFNTLPVMVKNRPTPPYKASSDTKKAAVLIPLCIVNNQVSLLYTVRATNLKTHRGQVSFPGGMEDIQLDNGNMELTALRETEEELGLKRERIKLWGLGAPFLMRTAVLVQPVIGLIDGILNIERDLKLNRDEVSHVFSVPIEQLCTAKLTGYTQYRTGYTTPVFHGGEMRIWGVTGIITSLFLTALLPKHAYTHRIKYVSL